MKNFNLFTNLMNLVKKARMDREWIGKGVAALRYAATVLLLLCLGVGNAWGTDITWNANSADISTLADKSVANITVGSSGNVFKIYAVRGGNNASISYDETEKALKFGDNSFYKPGVAVYIPSTSNTVTSIKFYLKTTNVTRNTKYGILDAVGLNSEPGSGLTSQTLTTSFAAYNPFDGSIETGKYFAFGGQFNGSGSIYIQKIVVTFAASCTAPSSVTVTGTNKYLAGQTVSLTATPTGGSGTATYKWQKEISSVWTDVENGTADGVTISGATTNNLQITPCNHNHSGQYRCVVSTGATCSTNSGAYGVHVFSINGGYYGGDWSHYEINWTSGTTGTATIHLNASSTFMFKVASNDGYYYGNGDKNYIIQPNNWDCGTENSNMRLLTGPEGDYTFTVNIEHGLDGEPYVNLQVGYPSVSHPAAGYMYINKWWDHCYVHYWEGTNNDLSPWGYDPEISSDRYVNICGTDYWYFPVIATYNKFIAKDAAGDPSNTTGDQVSTDHGGMYITHSGSWGWNSFTTYTISYAAGTQGTGTMSATTGICPGADQALPACSFTPNTGYEFASWTASSAVTVNSSSVTTGIADQATIQSVGANVTLTAQWRHTTTTITINANTANLGSTTPGTVTATYGSALPSFTAAAPANTNGYQLKGYYTDATGGTKIINANGTLVASTDYADGSGNWKYETSTLTLYAQYEAKTFSITYLDDDESTEIDASPTSYTYGVGVDELPTPSKSGYTFVNWYSQYCVETENSGVYDAECIREEIETTDYGDVTYIAKWTINSHTLTWNWGGGSTSATAGTNYTAGGSVNYGTSLSYPANNTMSKTGYTFTGWSSSPSTMPDNDLTITAQWSVNSYTLTWDLAGGTVTTAGTGAAVNATGTPNSSVNYNAAITAPVVTKTGYTFAGWDVTPVSNMPASNTTYTATWTCTTPTFGTNLSTSEVDYDKNASASALTVAATANGGTVTYQWYSNDKNSYDGATEIDDADEDSYTPSTSSAGTTYYFCVATNSTGSCSANSNIAKIVVAEGPCFEATITKTSESYSLSASGGSRTITSDATITSGGSITIVNNYSENRTFAFSENGMSITTSSGYAEFTLPSSSILTTGSVIRITGYSNGSDKGLMIIDDSGNKIAEQKQEGSLDFSYTVTAGSAINGNDHIRITRATSSNKVEVKSVTVTGCGEVTGYTVTATATTNMDGTFTGSDDITNSPVIGIESGTSVSYSDNTFTIGETTVTAPTTIAGKVTVDDGGEPYNASCTWRFDHWNNLPATVTADVDNVEAKYVPSFPINYTLGGGSFNSTYPTYYVYTDNEEDRVTLSTDVSKDGYTFDHWEDAGGTTRSYITCDYWGAFNMTAVWTPNTYDITYHLNGASWASAAGVASYTVGTGATLPLSSAMTNVGYTFDGWKDNSGLTGDSKTTIGTSEYGDKEFWAKWTENTYTITYNANGGSGDAMSNTVGHYVTLSDNAYTAPSGKIFVCWNTKSDGTGDDYSAGEEVELTANLPLYAKWATDYTITWDASAKLSGVAATPNLGGGNYTIRASVADWTGSLTSSMISTETSGVTITSVAVDNSSSPKTITATFNVGASVDDDAITFTLNVPAAGVYPAKESSTDIDIERCEGASGGGTTIFKARMKTSGLNDKNAELKALSSDANCTTDNYLSELEGGTLTLHLTSDKQAQAPNDSTIRLNENPAYWVIALSGGKSLQAGDIIKVRIYQNDAYLQKTSGDYSASTDLVLTKGTSTVNTYVVPNGMVGASTIYLKRISGKNTDLAYIEIYRPTETLVYFHVKDGLTNGNMPTDETQQTTSNNMAAVSGGTVYAGATTSGHLKIVNTNEIQLNNNTGYIKLVLPKNLAEGDILYFNSSHNYQVAITASASCSYTNHTAKKVYAIPASATDLIGKSTIYLWYHGSAANVKTLTVVRPGDGSGSSTIEPTLTWAAALESDPTWNSVEKTIDRNEGDPDFTVSASTTTNTLGTITYSSDDESAATVNASGRVHIVGAGTPTITATLAASGCYEEKSITYTINIYAPACEDPFPTITTKDLGCDGVELSVPSGSSSYQWYQDGVSMGGSYVAAKCTVTVAGEYYVEVTNTCARASNTVTIAAKESVSATKIVNSWYVKNGRRTPDIALVQTENATGFYVKIGDDKIWDEANSVTTGFGGCGFYLGEDGIIYLKGQKNDGTAPSGLDADETLKITATGCGGDADELSIDIKWQAATTLPSVAFVSLGTEKGAFTDTTANYYKTTPLYKYLDNTLGGGAFDLTAQNIYSTVDEQALREHYSQFDAILITDDPNTGKKKDGKSYVDAMGALIDIRPMLTMEAFVSKLANWKAKGINGNPSSPNPRQYGMKLECKDHEIFTGLRAESSNVEVETIDGVDYWTVLMVDSTKSPYSGVAYNASTSDKPALQGFSASDVSGLLLLGEISAGTLYAGVERQDEPAARLMLLGLNNKALPNALTDEGKKVIANALKYLLRTNMEDVDDCSNYFTGAAGTTDWNTTGNWLKPAVPNSPTTKVRILKPCVVSGGTFQVASVDIATSGKSGKGDGVANCTGSLTINADGALIVGGKVRTAVAPNFNSADLMPTTVNDLVINTSSTAQACLIMNNDAGDTKATVNLYSLGRNDGSYQFQYMAIPMSYVPVNPSFAGAGIYTYVWQESSNGWERRGYYTDLYAFEGVGITTTAATASNYQMKGSLAPTTTKEIALTRDNKGLNLVGNSWTAPIQISKLSEDNTDDNIEKVVYIYSTGYDAEDGALSGGTETAGQWLAIPFNAAGFEAWGGLKVIPSMQAFQVKVKEGGATLTLDYDKVVRGDNQALNAYLRAPKRTTEPSDIVLTRLRVADTKTHTDLYLFEGEQFSDAYDNGWEANFRAGDGRSAMLYARTAAGVMAVAALPELEGTQVFFIPGKETEYTFTFTGGDDTYYLNDIKEQKSTLINEANSYTFRYESGDAANRFIISRTPFEAPSVTTGITDLDAETPKAIKVIYNDKLYIIRGGRVYSADGSLVK